MPQIILNNGTHANGLSLSQESDQPAPIEIKPNGSLAVNNKAKANVASASTSGTPPHRLRAFRPIILTLVLMIGSAHSLLNAQLTGSVELSGKYSDNVFQLSENDLNRFDQDSSLLNFAETTDDLSLATRIELNYPLKYRWWKITPSVIGSITQNVSNTEKYRRDATFKLKVDRYYWNLSAQYAYNPHIYFRDFRDTDGIGVNADYSYSRNIYRVDLGVNALKNTTLKGSYRIEDFYYNEYFTEADGQAVSSVVGISQHLAAFTLDAGYEYREFSNDNLVDDDDSSYESNIYRGKITLPKMPLSDVGKTTWQPHLGLTYEQRYYQGDGSWYGGRADLTYTISTGFTMFLNPRWNLSLDYSHIFRNVLSDNQSLLTAKEYGENRIGTALRYKF